jgi:hypothetical protein
VDLDWNIKTAQCYANPLVLLDRWRPGGIWDHKKRDYNRPPSTTSIYEDYGNFEFAATCGAKRIPLSICLRGAGAVQQFVEARARGGGLEYWRVIKAASPWPPYGDNPDDPPMLRAGFAYWEDYRVRAWCGCAPQ